MDNLIRTACNKGPWVFSFLLVCFAWLSFMFALQSASYVLTKEDKERVLEDVKRKKEEVQIASEERKNFMQEMEQSRKANTQLSDLEQVSIILMSKQRSMKKGQWVASFSLQMKQT